MLSDEVEKIIAESEKYSAINRAYDVIELIESQSPSINGLSWSSSGDTLNSSSQLLSLGLMILVNPIPLIGKEEFHSWNMPFLTREVQNRGSQYNDLVSRLNRDDSFELPKIRPTIEVISFLPFPKVNIKDREYFDPEFMININVDASTTNSPEDYHSTILKYGDEVVIQGGFKEEDNNFLLLPDSHRCALFRSVLQGNDQLSQLGIDVPISAGELEILIYRNRRPRNVFSRLAAGSLHERTPFLLPINGGLIKDDDSKVVPINKIHTVKGEIVSSGYSDNNDRSHLFRKGNNEDYVLDPKFPIQPIRFRFVGVREGSAEATLRYLKSL